MSLLSADYPRAHWIPTDHGLRAAARLARRWRRLAPERLVVFPLSLSARLAASRSKIATRVGFAPRPGDPWQGPSSLGWKGSVPLARRGERHLEDEYLDLALAAGGVLSPSRPLTLPREAALAAERALGGFDRGEWIALAPGARYGPAKRWHPARFAQAARRLSARLGARVVIVGEAEDASVCAEVAEALGGLALDLSGRTNLVALAGVLRRTRAVLSNDSGAAHLAAALGRPTVAVFASTDPRWTAPRGERATALWRRVRCAPCFRRTCPWADPYPCLRIVEPHEVVAAAEALIGLPDGPTAGTSPS